MKPARKLIEHFCDALGESAGTVTSGKTRGRRVASSSTGQTLRWPAVESGFCWPLKRNFWSRSMRP